MPTALAIGHDERDAFYWRPTSFKMVSKRWAQLPGDGWQFVASCCHRGHAAFSSSAAAPLAIEPANASRASGAACAQLLKTAAVVRRGSAAQSASASSPLVETPAAISVLSGVASVGGDGLAISSVVFCAGMAVIFGRRRMRGNNSGSAEDFAGLGAVSITSQRSAAAAGGMTRYPGLGLGSGPIGGGLAWPGSRERLPVRL